ncbi:MAG TPA: hypothetical protein VFN30_15610 [Chitinophagaceae bacterium]|nr:hypothetical protein [Chitinophagaceae bacterium]
MKKDTLYEVKSTKECIAYIENAGLSIHDDDPNLSIKSKSGVIYVLPNGEVVLVPSNFDLDYPGIIFKNKSAFEHYAARDFFPIGEDNMTWFERYNKQIRQFRKSPEFYSKALKTLDITLPFKNAEEIKSAFLKVQSFIASTNPKDFSFERVHIIYSFGLAVTNYFIDYKGYKLLLKKGYENYNPITNIEIEKEGMVKDVLYTCLIYIETCSPDSLKVFVRSLNLN